VRCLVRRFLYSMLFFGGALALPRPASAQTVKWGDVNGDGTIGAVDAQAILTAVVGLPLPSDFAKANGDANCDGVIGAVDAQVVLSYVVSLNVSQFCVGTPRTVLPSLQLLEKPFAGDYSVYNYMDHDVPLEGIDANGRVVTAWGEQTYGGDGHAGYDYLMPVGTPILAAADGVVLLSATTSNFFCGALNRIVTDQHWITVVHTASNGTRYASEYVHLSRNDVAVGQHVTTGQQLGLSGDTGCSTAPHLHFQVERYDGTNDGKPALVDPFGWSGAYMDPWEADPHGAASIPLWKTGRAPSDLSEISAPLNYTGTSYPPTTNPVVLTRLIWMGPHDEVNANNELVQVELDPRYAPPGNFDLSGYIIQNNAHVRFVFPPGTTISAGVPIRVHIGSGTNSGQDLYWGQPRGIFDNKGDCAQFFPPNAAWWALLGYAVTCK
jgi:murein DD-endopeptidase MepM/ murein hydrolase activator NlpD